MWAHIFLPGFDDQIFWDGGFVISKRRLRSEGKLLNLFQSKVPASPSGSNCEYLSKWSYCWCWLALPCQGNHLQGSDSNFCLQLLPAIWLQSWHVFIHRQHLRDLYFTASNLFISQRGNEICWYILECICCLVSYFFFICFFMPCTLFGYKLIILWQVFWRIAFFWRFQFLFQVLFSF